MIGKKGWKVRRYCYNIEKKTEPFQAQSYPLVTLYIIKTKACNNNLGGHV
ncbi:hypothetical protein HARRISON_24 [Paenibacillus phage Harrison]|uniref:Uncharacterized protein n=2 Tax=Harrisonvirus harrison TaxID=1982221 RepID=A0A0K2CYS0_9CAUD|nr:hypothetical protein HARRISON_24 [Paenibacillus phage Harrison]ALA12486.1 hypothetical protein HARRISON_24 [Paenibacillus phage Harrison]ALA12645.1 hypothetical protein PAISLEY_24 [Paenibacillus phage Paisley]